LLDFNRQRVIWIIEGHQGIDTSANHANGHKNLVAKCAARESVTVRYESTVLHRSGFVETDS
jgi:hypothetical protein